MHTLAPTFPTALRPADALRALSNPQRLRVLNYLREHGPATLTDLGERLNLPELRLRHHVNELIGIGLVRLKPGGGGSVVSYSAVGWARLRRKLELGITDMSSGLTVVS